LITPELPSTLSWPPEITKENYKILEKEDIMPEILKEPHLNPTKPILFKMILQSPTEVQCLRMDSTFLSSFNSILQVMLK
jgi:hypothetical protein